MYAGFFAVVACISAWVALFGNGLIAAGNRRVLLRVAVVALLVGAAASMTAPALVEHASFTIVAVLATCAVAVEVALLLVPRHRSLLPLMAGTCSLFAAPSLTAFSRIAYRMWSTPVDAGSVRYGAEFTLAFVHVLFIVICFVLTGVLWVRYFGRDARAVRLSAIAAFISLVSLVVAFIWTVPRGGDEGTLLWLFIVPAFALAALVLLATCAPIAILSGVRCMERGLTGRMNGSGYQRQLPADGEPPAQGPLPGNLVALGLRDCPSCNTRGVLPTSDGRCPNCKRMLGEVVGGPGRMMEG